MASNLSIYLHIPFCRHRCSYCDFNTYAGQEARQPTYVKALCEEISLVSQSAGEKLPVHTIFFGGGTPSLLSAPEVEAILTTIDKNFSFQEPLEMSLEANPGTVSLDYLRKLRSLGVNRLSMGAQSSHPDDLRILERQHDYFDVIRAVEWARKAGFDNISLDLMFGLPEQPLERWQGTLENVIRLRPEHLSLYALGIEYGTPFQHWTGRGLLPEPDNDLAADMYEYASDRLEEAGYAQYEISNWSQHDREGKLLACKHNLQYWRGLQYLGFGAGAHGYAADKRTANVLSITGYIDRINKGGTEPFPAGPAAASITSVDRWTEMEETMMVGLRLTDEGVSLAGFEERFGVPLQQIFPRQIDELIAFGLLEITSVEKACLRLTRRGRLLGNQVFLRFVGNQPSKVEGGNLPRARTQ